MAYTKLFQSIVTSTIWMEDDRTRIVWVTMLALADKHGEVMGSIPGIARIAGVPVEDCRKAIQRFLSPDPDSRTPDNEGRRIEVIEGGWALVNYAKYRALASKEDAKQKTADRVRRLRERNKALQTVTVTGPNGGVTQDRDIAEAEAEAEKTKTRQPPASLARFDEFWAMYPRKVAKPKAQAKWVKLTEAERAAIIADIPRKSVSEQWTKDGGAFIPHPTTYLSQRRWEDEAMLLAHRNGVVQHGMTDEEILAAAL